MYLLEFYNRKAMKVCSTALEGVITVGRSVDNDVTLEDVSISRHHASFEVDLAGGEHVVLCDRGSTNGVVVNGQRIKDRTVRITPQEQIQIGLFRVVTCPPETSPDPVLGSGLRREVEDAQETEHGRRDRQQA